MYKGRVSIRRIRRYVFFVDICQNSWRLRNREVSRLNINTFRAGAIRDPRDPDRIQTRLKDE